MAEQVAIKGIQLLHKRYATSDWANHTLQAGELGLDLTTFEVRIGTAANQAWANAAPVGIKSITKNTEGGSDYLKDVSFDVKNGTMTLIYAAFTFADDEAVRNLQTDLDALELIVNGDENNNGLVEKFNALDSDYTTHKQDFSDAMDLLSGNIEGVDGKVATINGSDTGSSMRQVAESVRDAYNTATVAPLAERVGAVEGAVATKVEAEAYNAKVQELQGAINTKVATETYNAKVEELEDAIDAKVAQSAYDTKVAELQGAIDTKVAQSAYDTKVKALDDEDDRLEGLINVEKGRIDGIVADYETATHAAQTYETIAEANKVRGRVEALEQAALSGLSRQIVEALPEVANALDNVIYMIKRTAGVNNKDVYDEYLLVEVSGVKQFELLGNTEIDLSNYYTKEQVEEKDAAVANELKNTYLPANFYNKTEIDGTVEGINNSVQGVYDHLAGNYYTQTDTDGLIGAIYDELAQSYYNIEAIDTKFGNADQALVDAKAELAGEDTAIKNRLVKVENKLNDVADTETVKALINTAVEGEKGRAEGIENGLADRIKAIEDKGLENGSVYAKQADLEATDAIADAADALSKENKAAIDVLNGTTADSVSGKISAAITALNISQYATTGALAEVSGVANAADTLSKANAGKIATLEAVTYEGDGKVTLTKEGNVVKAAHAATFAEAQTEGFYTFSFDKYGHITAVKAITVLDGNA